MEAVQGEFVLPDNVRFFVADTETTDAKPGYKACEVGWVEIDEEFNILNRVESLIDPERDISPSASGVHGLIYEDVAESPTIEEFFSLAGTPGCYGSKLEGPSIIIGHKISFDSPILGPYMPSLLGELCTLRWSQRLFPEAEDHKLSTLKYALKLPRTREASHRVMVDIMDAYHLTRHICERLGCTLRELVIESQKPMFVEIFTFGSKHRGERTEDVPTSYLKWMQREIEAGQMTIGPDLAYTIDLVLNNKKKK